MIRRLAGGASWLRIPPEGGATTDHGLEAAGAAAFRREVFDRVGLFDESFVRGEDTEFTGRLRAAGIAVTYEPRVRIGHYPEPRLRTVLKNNFAGGRAARRLAAAREGRTAGFSETLRLGLGLGPRALYWSCWRAWRTGGPAGFLPLLPVLILLETAHRTGYFCAGAGPGKNLPAAAAGPLSR